MFLIFNIKLLFFLFHLLIYAKSDKDTNVIMSYEGYSLSLEHYNDSNIDKDYLTLSTGGIYNISLSILSVTEYNLITNTSATTSITHLLSDFEIKKTQSNDLRYISIGLSTEPESSVEISIFFFIDNGTYTLNNQSYEVSEGFALLTVDILQKSVSLLNNFTISFEITGSSVMKEIEKNKYDYESGYAVISDKISYDNLLLDTHLNIDKNVFSVNTEMTTSIISFVLGLKTKWIKPRIGVVDYVWMVIIGLSILFFIGLVSFKIVTVINIYMKKKKEKVDIDNIHENIIQEN